MSHNLPAAKDHLRKLTRFSGSNGYAIIKPDDGEKGKFVTDSRYEIAVKTEIDPEQFEVSTKSDEMMKSLDQMAKDKTGDFKVGIDGHLFTKAQVDNLRKSTSFSLEVNTDEKPVVQEATEQQTSDSTAASG